ncbi:hypothetical protein ASE61_13550 [Bosea sp. Root670]|uniref:hypothetical protein n=1 Tax=Bosea sp. Root670 TaxID=1736583 RepID=UPI0007127D79|nr:hypothetical protein [Bosea sp. Root670]KRE03483.1 hypothetical protein ASE61_13550 [Bosea sp. Root670]
MPFSSLNDPADLARAYASLEKVWNRVKDTVAECDHAKERERIAYMVAAFAPLALDEDDLTQNVLFHLDRDVAAWPKSLAATRHGISLTSEHR